MNQYSYTSLFVLFSLVFVSVINAQVINEGFDEVFGAYEDGDEPVDSWTNANASADPGPTGMFPGLSELKGYFDAQSGDPDSYLAMNYNNSTSGDTTISHWLMTPVRQFNNGDRFSFWTRTVEASQFPDRLVVRLSTAGDSIDVGEDALTVGDFTTTLEDINPMYQLGGYPEEWTRYEFELDGIQPGVSGRIALQYLVTNWEVNGSYIGIDSFEYLPIVFGDGNGDGLANLLDIQFFVDLLASGGYLENFDFNNDGLLTLVDVDPFVNAIVNQ